MGRMLGGAVATAAAWLLLAGAAPAEDEPYTPASRDGEVIARPVGGRVRVLVAGTSRYVSLDAVRSLPTGTIVDATRGKVALTTVDGKDTMTFYDGRFAVGRTGAYITLDLVGGSFKGCSPARSSASSAAARKVRVRRLWGDGKGRFKVRGRDAAATVRGTKFLVTDRCDATTIYTQRGVVSCQATSGGPSRDARAGQTRTYRHRR